MNYDTLQNLNNVLENVRSDIATVAITIAILMIVIYTIMVMFTDDTNVSVYNKRWENLRKVFLCAVIIAAAGAIVGFGQTLGAGL